MVLGDITLNELALDKLVAEHVGLESSSSKSAGDWLSVQSKVDEVARCMYTGDVENAIALLRQLCPSLLEDQRLYFRLQKQHFIELARHGDPASIQKAIQCSRTTLAPLAMDAYPEAYSEFKHVMLVLMYSQHDADSPVAKEWSLEARNSLTALLASTLYYKLKARPPRLAMLLRYLTMTYNLFCATPEIDAAVQREAVAASGGISEGLLPPGTPHAPSPLPPDILLMEPYAEADVQALVHAVDVDRQRAVDALKLADGNLAEAFMNELLCLRLNASMLDALSHEYVAYRGMAAAGVAAAPSGESCRPGADAASSCGGQLAGGRDEQGGGRVGGGSAARADELLAGKGAQGGRGVVSHGGDDAGANGMTSARPDSKSDTDVQKMANGTDGAEGGGACGLSPMDVEGADAAPGGSMLPGGAAGRDDVATWGGGGVQNWLEGGGSAGAGGGNQQRHEALIQQCAQVIKCLRTEGLTEELLDLLKKADGLVPGPLPQEGDQSLGARARPDRYDHLLFELKRCEYACLVAAGREGQALKLARTQIAPLTLRDPSLVPSLKSLLMVLAYEPPMSGADADVSAHSGDASGDSETRAGNGMAHQQAPHRAEAKSQEGHSVGPTLPTPEVLASSLQSALGHSLGMDEPRLWRLMRSLLRVHAEWFRRQMCQDPFLNQFPEIKSLNASFDKNAHVAGSGPLFSGAARASGLPLFLGAGGDTSGYRGGLLVDDTKEGEEEEEDDEEEDDDEMDESPDSETLLEDSNYRENSILTLMEIMAMSRVTAINLLAEYGGSVESVMAHLLN